VGLDVLGAELPPLEGAMPIWDAHGTNFGVPSLFPAREGPHLVLTNNEGLIADAS
jgi:hypothetical protein